MKTKKYIVGIIATIVLLLAIGVSQTVSANAGITPESPWYFLDTSSESLRDFFTTNPEGKARLQIAFATERVEEIKVILEEKGVQTEALTIAQSRLQEHLAKANTIVLEQKTQGKDVQVLAQELNNGLEQPKSTLAQAFMEQKRALDIREKELKIQLKAARQAGDMSKQEAVAQELGQVKGQLKLLELKEEELEQGIDEQEERLEEEMEDKKEAEEAIRETEKKLEEVKRGVTEVGIVLSATSFSPLNSLLGQAKSALATGNYNEAGQFAEQAQNSLENVENEIERLEDEKEKQEEDEVDVPEDSNSNESE